MTVQLTGLYYPPYSARQCEATARISADGKSLEVCGGGGNILAAAALRQIKATSRLGGLHRKLEFPGGSIFETSDNDAVDALVRGYSGTLSRLERSWRLALASVLVIAGCAAWFAMYGVPIGARWLAQRTPQSVTRLVTNQTLGVMNNGALLPSKLPPARQQAVADRFRTIAGWEERGLPGYRLLLRDAPHIGPNAFALPDGRIVVTDQLVVMVQNDAELDGVLAHEMAHVNRAHGLQRVYQASLVPAAIAFITGDASQFAQLAAILPGILLGSAYSRTFEQQADDDSAALLRQHGEDPSQLANLLERMDRKNCSKTGCGPSWLGSHPATAARAARLRRAPAP